MSKPPPLAHTETAGRIEGVRLGVRAANVSDPGPVASSEGSLLLGTQRLGALECSVALDAAGSEARLDVRVRNAGAEPVRLNAVVLGFQWTGADASALRFLRHGWQSWSFTGGRELDDAGEPEFPSGPWLRSLHHGIGQPADDRAGWHESDLVSVAVDPEGRACLVGVLERGLGTGLVYWRRVGDTVRVEAEIRLEIPIDPGQELALDPVRVALGSDESRLLEDYADALGEEAGARTTGPFQTGWCSWYQFFHDVTEDQFLRNLEALSKHRGRIPVDVVQLDDGYQRAIGDWLETNEKFPRGIAPLAADVRSAGFRPGLWTAPFCVAPESRLFEEHPDWLLQADGGPHLGLIHPMWSKEARIYALDPSREEVCAHLERVFSELVEMGFSYQKLDFLYVAAMQAVAADPRMTRAGRLRAGLEAVRRGCGEEAFLLGCGCPLGPAVGIVDGMRIGPDVAPSWRPAPGALIPGIEATVPSTRSAVRSILARAWMHRRLWLNDPDCLMVRTRDTELTPAEVRSLAGAIAVTGGMVIFSDDIPNLAEEDLALLRETTELAREVDAAGPRGRARAVGLLDGEFASGMVGRTAGGGIAMLLNAEDEPASVDLDLARAVPAASGLPPRPLLGTRDPDPRDPSRASARLEPHESLVLRVHSRPLLAVFCDYDGTFAKQDVGSTLARRYASERRPALWERLSRGELTAWEYNMELLDGLELPEETLDAFLKTVEPDPGAHDLVAWCEERQIPFRVLSDGFDRNLDRLQELHGVRFAYDANHLWYEHGAWRLAPGHPNPSCSCGTGTCKQARIREFRGVHPGTAVVHIGNGRVSDLCAARACDVVFAKDTLAEELETQGVAYEPFETLHDVVAGLERMRDRLARED